AASAVRVRRPGACSTRARAPAANQMTHDDPQLGAPHTGSNLHLLSRDKDDAPHEGVRSAVIGESASVVKCVFERLAGLDEPGIERTVVGRYGMRDLI